MLLSGCAGLGPAGRSTVADELLRIRGETGIALVSAEPARAVFAVRGERVVIAPPAGYCLDQQSIEIAGSTAFSLVADCLAAGPSGVAESDGNGNLVAISLPRSFPGILTYSIASDVALKPGGAGLDSFGRALEGPSGRALLRRGNGVGARVVERRQIGGTVYVLAEEDAEGAAIFTPRFWRAFAMVSGRLVMATVSGFSDRPVDEQAMLNFLARGMTALHAANGSSPDAEETRMAGSFEPALPTLPSAGTGDGEPETALAEAQADLVSDGEDPVHAPLPPARTRGVRVATAASVLAAAPAPSPVRRAEVIALPTATVALAAAGSSLAPVVAPAASVKPR